MSQQATNQPVIANHTIVDTDVHLSWLPDREDLLPYVDEPHASRLRVKKYPLARKDGHDRTMGGKIDLPRVDTPADMNEVLCHEFGVDHPLVNPTSGLPGVPVADLAVSLATAYNEWMLDNVLDEYDHFYGLGGIATQKPAKAAEELDRLGDEKQIVGAYIRTSGPNLPLGDPAYDVMYQAAEDNGLHIGYHGGATDFLNDFSKQYQTLDSFLEVHSLAHPWSQMLTLMHIIFQGVPEKFPDLNFLFMEAGIGWAAYMIGRLNEEYAKRRSEAPLLERSPEEYIRESCYFTQQALEEFHDPEHLKLLIDIVGPENIMFSTDYPHWEFDHPSALDSLFQRYYDRSDWEKILSKNAINAFEMPIST